MNQADITVFPNSVVENDQVRSRYVCCICKLNDVNILFLPCAHAKICESCLMKYQLRLCIYCYKDLEANVKIKF